MCRHQDQAFGGGYWLYPSAHGSTLIDNRQVSYEIPHQLTDTRDEALTELTFDIVKASNFLGKCPLERAHTFVELLHRQCPGAWMPEVVKWFSWIARGKLGLYLRRETEQVQVLPAR